MPKLDWNGKIVEVKTKKNPAGKPAGLEKYSIEKLPLECVESLNIKFVSIIKYQTINFCMTVFDIQEEILSKSEKQG